MRKTIKRFNRDIKRSMHTAIVAAFGFLTALVWKDLIVEWVGEITQASPIKGKLITAILVTILSALGIFIATQFTKIKR